MSGKDVIYPRHLKARRFHNGLNGPKIFPGDAIPGPPHENFFPAWAYWLKPSLHGLSLNKTPIKKTTQYYSGWVIKPDQTKLDFTKPDSCKWKPQGKTQKLPVKGHNVINVKDSNTMMLCVLQKIKKTSLYM